MRFTDSIFSSLLQPLDRRRFKAIVARHAGDAYDKSFRSWDHMLALIFAQLSGAGSLRAVVAGFNAHSSHHYHLHTDKVSRSTLADANARRPAAVFSDVFAQLAGGLGRKMRAEGQAMVRILDSTPIPLGQWCDCATWNGRIHGLKLHLAYDPADDRPQVMAITPATVNDIEAGRRIAVEPGATYVFDKAYCRFDWWTNIAEAGAFFVTRPKTNSRWKTVAKRPLGETQGRGFTVLADTAVNLASKGNSKLPIPLRRIRIKPDGAKAFHVITNDMSRGAAAIAALYKGRWQIELLFRWLKQNLKLRSFLGRNENAIRLQILAAMIAFALLRLAARLHRITMPALRFAELATSCLFQRKPIARIDKPPPINPSKPKSKFNPNQIEFCYA